MIPLVPPRVVGYNYHWLVLTPAYPASKGCAHILFWNVPLFSLVASKVTDVYALGRSDLPV